MTQEVLYEVRPDFTVERGTFKGGSAVLRAYAPLVDVGSYLIVQDTGMWQPLRDQPGGWASDAVEEFLQENDAFVADHSRERFWLTNCAGAWLKRVR